MASERSTGGAAGAGRRAFLRLAGVGASAAGSVAAVAGARPAQAAAVVEAAPEAPAPGYRETEHVKKAYEVARF